MQNQQHNKQPKKTNSPLKSFGILVLLALILSSIFFYSPLSKSGSTVEAGISELKAYIANDQIVDNEILVTGNKVSYKLVNGKTGFTYKEPNAQISDIFSEAELAKLDVSVKPANNFWGDLLISIIPILLIAFFFIYIFRQAQSSNNQAISFGRSGAKLFDKSKKIAKFKDVAGADEAKEELVEIVDFLKNPTKYKKMGAKIPKGVLLIGSPGTGKTLLARAVAGEADVPFFSISGSEFVEMFVGVGASRVRDLFGKAKLNAPCIIFIDEIDAVGRKRGAGLGGGHDEREQTLNQILTEMDGFDSQSNNIIVIAATNRPDVLDPALLRPGRFDRRVVVDKPNLKEREEILKVHAEEKPLAKDSDLSVIARQTPGFAGADLENIMNEAAIIAAKNNQKTITQQNLITAIEKSTIGLEKKSRKLSEKELKITAYHEVGHALVGHLTKECDPVNKVSIVSRGRALGVTWFLPEKDSHLYSKSKFEAELASLLGGYCAEEIFFNEVTTGASSDLERATDIARQMVTRYGMSELGPVIFGDNKEEVFLGKDFGHTKNYSEAFSAKIDELIHQIVMKAYAYTKTVIKDNKALMEKISEDLLKKENLDREEFLSYFTK